MVTEEITNQNYEEYMDMVPHEFDNGLVSGRYFAIGAKLAGRVVGAAVWEAPDEKKLGTLHSIYVAPEARRLGTGTELLRALTEKIEENGLEGLEFSYVAEGDRLTLSPFFEKYKVELDISPCELGSVTLKEVLEAMTKKNIKAQNASGKRLSEIPKSEYPVIDKWMHRHIGECVTDYLSLGSAGYISMNNGNVESALLFSTEFEGVLNLTYAYAAKGSEVKLPGLMALAVLDLTRNPFADITIEMLLVNEASRKLYEGLFGPAPFKVSVVRGAFK